MGVLNPAEIEAGGGLPYPNTDAQKLLLRTAMEGAAPERLARHWFTMRPIGQRVMATPPTITTGTSSSFASSFLYPAVSGSGFYGLASQPSDRFAISRARPSAGQAAAGTTFDTVTTNAAGTAFSSPSVGISFIHDGQIFELEFGSNSTSYLLKVDDEYISLTPQAVGSSGSFYAKYDFGSVARRRIDIIGFNTFFGGVRVGMTDSIDPAPIRGPRAIIMGDSFTAAQPNGWTTAFADAMGWDDVWASGVGGTGYVATNSGASRTFGQRLQRDVIDMNPQFVMLLGSVNDYGSSPSTVGAAAADVYSRLRAALPNILIVAGLNAAGGVGKITANALAVRDAVKAAAIANGVVWLDPTDMPISFAGGSPLSGTTVNAPSAGATSINLTGGVSAFTNPAPASTVEIGSGATRERVQIKTYAQVSPGVVQCQLASPLQYAHAAGEVWTQVGSSYLTGSGRVGATAGFGNSDLFVSSDGIHPEPVGHRALGITQATLVRDRFGN